MYLQLHYEVQVVWALVDVLQSHDILMLYPGEGEQNTHFACCQPAFISAQGSNEAQLAFPFVETMPCQLKNKTLFFLLSGTALVWAPGDSVCSCVHLPKWTWQSVCFKWRRKPFAFCTWWREGGFLEDTNQWVMKQQPPSAGVPEENKIRRITTLAACVQATNKVLILKK